MKIKLSSYKGIIFDLDDTLIDRKKAFKKVFTKLYMENKNINVTVANPAFYDEKNERLNA